MKRAVRVLNTLAREKDDETRRFCIDARMLTSRTRKIESDGALTE